MNLFQHFDQKIKKIVEDIDIPEEALELLSRISTEPPRDASHGDLATNAAMVLAKPARKNPREIAQTIADELLKLDEVDEATIAGPGFINLWLSSGFWLGQMTQMLSQGQDYGRGLVSDGEKVNVEYVSANPTGPMHVGHCRGAVVGDALANLLQFAGFDVTKEYYVNDAGGQIDVLAGSLYHRYREALGEDVGPVPEGMYPGGYLIPPAQKLVEIHNDSLISMVEAERTALLKDFAIDAMMDMIREDLAALNIHHDVFFSERSLHALDGNHSKIDGMLAGLRDQGLVYEGKLPPPKGEVPEDWEDREQTLFKASDFGDDTDRALKKSNGDYTYFAADVAYFADKYAREFKRMVFVLGADHSGYAKRLKAVASAVAGDNATLDVLFCQLVKLLRDGQPVAMGKRSGNFVTLRDVVDEVGRDAVRFMMLYRKPEAPLDFDFAKVTEQSKDNPVFYVQYAHARTCSVFRQVAEELPDLDVSATGLAKADLSLLADEGELALIKKAAEFPRIIEQAAKADEPHRLAFYLYELASELHGHWTKGKEKPELRFINHENAQLTLSRLAMLRSMASIIASGLAIVGADAPEEMR
ncbi:MAG: arginine--tRNA ligase [Rhizobiaceae bacterium]|nr:arginine--tRNA ligase [Rhizobiaceae bacterium]